MRDITLGDTFYHLFTTRQFSDGVPTTLSGTPVVSAYEDNSATQITAGITLGVDHDSVTGLNLLTVVATGGNGFESGKSYSLVITTGTVGGTSVVGEVVGQFTVELSAAAVDLANATDGLGAIKSAVDTVDTVVDGIQTDLSNGTDGLGALKALIDALNDPTAAAIADAVWDEAQSGHTSAGSFGEVATEIASILADTNELQSDDVPGLIAALNDPTVAAIADGVWDELQSGHVTAGSFGEIATEIASILADTNELQSDDVPRADSCPERSDGCGDCDCGLGCAAGVTCHGRNVW